jgi:hypothetical protein
VEPEDEKQYYWIFVVKIPPLSASNEVYLNCRHLSRKAEKHQRKSEPKEQIKRNPGRIERLLINLSLYAIESCSCSMRRTWREGRTYL